MSDFKAPIFDGAFFIFKNILTIQPQSLEGTKKHKAKEMIQITI